MVLIVAIAIMAVSLGLYYRELKLYRAQRDGTWQEGTDLFVYTKARFRTRICGLVVAMALSLALAAWEIAPPATPATFTAYLSALSLLLVLLVAAVIVDFFITIKTAAPHDLTRQEDPSQRTRSR